MSRARWFAASMIAVTLTILALIIWLITVDLRARLREHIIKQDSHVLTALEILQRRDSEVLEAQLDDALNRFNTAMEISRVPGVLSVGLFDRNGHRTETVPPNVEGSDLSQADLAEVSALQPVSRYTAKEDLGELLGAQPGGSKHTVPILEVIIPLRSKEGTRMDGAAQFVMDGTGIANQFQALDNYLKRVALGFFLGGGSVIGIALGLSFWHLEKTNRLLRERTGMLLRANHELSMSAKTSALGAVTAHLIHGLKNPLFGLQNFVSAGAEQATDWKDAAASTRRMQEMIGEVVRILQEETAPAAYEISMQELAELLEQKLAPLAKERGVSFGTSVTAKRQLGNREANLVMLILTNLVQNAIQATPRGRSAGLRCSEENEKIVWEVCDEGGGLPGTVLERLFTPAPSSKEGGTGLGLAISKQLANHLGGSLELAKTSAEGTVFQLFLPASALLAKR